jgi:hypothetical protein
LITNHDSYKSVVRLENASQSQFIPNCGPAKARAKALIQQGRNK